MPIVVPEPNWNQPVQNWLVRDTNSSITLTEYWNQQTWTKWNTMYTTTSTTTLTSRIIWNDWNATGTGGNDWYNHNIQNDPRYNDQRYGFQTDRIEAVRRAVAPARTEDEWAAIRQQRDIERAERDTLNAAARAEGGRLLALVLDPAQLASLETNRYFDLVGASGQRWRVYYGTSGNVKALDEQGKEIMAICAHPRLRETYTEVGGGFLPTEDVIAAQALHLIHDDAEFLAKANIHRGRERILSLVPALRAA